MANTTISVTPEMLRNHSNAIRNQSSILQDRQRRTDALFEELNHSFGGLTAGVMVHNAMFYAQKFKATYDTLSQYSMFVDMSASSYEELDGTLRNTSDLGDGKRQIERRRFVRSNA